VRLIVALAVVAVTVVVLASWSTPGYGETWPTR
jgi:hypothetical protein